MVVGLSLSHIDTKKGACIMEQQPKDIKFKTDSHGNEQQVCPTCNGKGIVIHTKYIKGVLEEVQSANCPECKRLGYITKGRNR